MHSRIMVTSSAPGAIKNNKTDQLFQFSEAMPLRECRYVVFTDEIVNLGASFAPSNFFDGVNCIRRSRAIQFAIIKYESRFPLDCSLQHRQSRLGAGDRRTFERRNCCWNKNDLLQSERLKRFACKDQVPVMNRVECPAVDRDLHQKNIARNNRFLFLPARSTSKFPQRMKSNSLLQLTLLWAARRIVRERYC